MLKIEIYDRAMSVAKHSVRLFYNLGGAVSVNDRKLQQFDILLANEFEDLMVAKSTSDISYAIFFLDPKKIKSLFRSQKLVFECNSSLGLNSNYHLLQECLVRLLLSWSDEGLLAEAEFERDSYDLCLLLMQHFRVSKLSLTEESLAEQLKRYIEGHFQDDVTLSTISAEFYMTPPYFSKVFKENVGETFYKYLTYIRLEHAKSLLDKREGNLLQVSLDSGFPNVNALNRAFKEVYHILPSDYRKQIQKDSNIIKQPTYQELSDLLRGQVKEKSTNQTQILTVDTTIRRPIKPYWKKIINIGEMSHLELQQARTQLIEFQSYISFEFARLQLVIPKEEQEEYSFYREESFLDFFVKQGMKFQFVLDYRQIQRKTHTGVFLKQFISHFSNRYSIDRVRQWRFELNYMTVFDEEKCLQYGCSYQEISQILSAYKIEETLFGPGFVLGDVESLRLFQSMISVGKLPKIQHLTFHVRQDVAYWSSNQIVMRKVTDSQHVRNQLEILRGFLEQDFHQIHIVEWKDYSTQQPWINDTTFKAANIIRTALTCIGELADIAWNIPLDLLVGQHSGKLLAGYEGCLTSHGIAKPTFYAHYFLNRHGEEFLAKDDYSLVTSSGHNVTIVSHNCSKLSYRYYLDENEASHYQHADYFENEEVKDFTYCLQGLKAGNYLIKTRLINCNSGSIKELTSQVFLDGTLSIGESEIDFLRKQAIPHLTVAKAEVLDDSLSLTMTLEPNEIRHTHIIYLY